MSVSNTTNQTRLGKTNLRSPSILTKSPKEWRAFLQMLVVLFKLRIVFLLVMAATGGAFLAAGGWPGLGPLLLVWITGTMAAAGASSLNQYLERHSDGAMGRTHRRPLVTGAIERPGWVPVVGILLILIPSLSILPFNPALAFFLVAGAAIYVGVYTVWLKPRTILNIVIGGAAGSAAVLSGSAAVGAWNHTGALVLALILFLWTPFHFWSLGILYRDEYARVDIPMLPARTTPHQAAWWVMLHTVPTGLAGLLLTVLPGLGWIYFVPMLLVTADLFRHNVNLIREPSPGNARAFFMATNIYLLVLLLMICVDAMLPF